MRYDLTDNMTEEMIGRNHHKEKKINFHSIGVENRSKWLIQKSQTLTENLHLIKSLKSWRADKDGK
jgi:hypothetical protein